MRPVTVILWLYLVVSRYIWLYLAISLISHHIRAGFREVSCPGEGFCEKKPSRFLFHGVFTETRGRIISLRERICFWNDNQWRSYGFRCHLQNDSTAKTAQPPPRLASDNI
jgi:hypothetical protein